ncbi:Uncharacterised protein [Streptococcus macacae NCTC 11558]|nr:Uncharacterised protein [Streptococcus macacae NCTC 11558]
MTVKLKLFLTLFVTLWGVYLLFDSPELWQKVLGVVGTGLLLFGIYSKSKKSQKINRS